MAMKMFVCVIGLYLMLIIQEFFFKEYIGFDKRALFDLLFFYFIAFMTAKEFGFNQGQVITLEGHMLEKTRMEQELAEAAEIAKAFLPGASPNWNFCNLGVFHRSLSESSGDWFTFEKSPSGRFHHMIMCDITGHGVQAAIVVSTCKTVLSSMLAENQAAMDTEQFVANFGRTLNKILFRHGSGNHVSTLLGLTFEPAEGRVWYVAAGHPNPLLIGSGGQIKPLLSRFNVLGVHSDIDLSMASCLIKSGDEILAYTDGLPAASHLRALKTILAEKTDDDKPRDLEALYRQLWAAETAKTKTEPNDDVSVVWFRVRKLEAQEPIKAPA